MFKAFFTATVAATILALSATVAFAQTELDQDKANSNFSPNPEKGTIVVRVDKDGQMAILNADHNIVNNEDAQKIAKSGNFIALNKDKVVVTSTNELDNDREQTGWYVVRHGYNYYPTFSYGYSYYQPYYAYAYNNCNYFYYTPFYNYWNTGWYGGAGWNGYYPYANAYSYRGYGYGYGYGWNNHGYYGYRGGYGYRR